MSGRFGERRGEVPFVAIRVGRSNDPREVLGLSRELRIERATALGFVCLWEEFLMEVGDALTGRVKGYSHEHIAAKLGWKGPPKKLIAALHNAGLLNQQRNTYFHPYWSASITGQYALDRAEQRKKWRDAKRRGRGGDVQEDSSGHPVDVPPESHEKADIQKEMNDGGGGARPPAPPARGGGVGASRWEWIRTHHERPNNSRGCVPILEAMDAETWALVQWVVDQARRGGALSSSRGKRALKADSYRFLRSELYLEFARERQKKLAEQKIPKASASVEPVKDKLAASIAFILEQLNDPDLSEVDKEKARQRWRAQNPDVRPPWEDASGGPGAHEEARRAQA